MENAHTKLCEKCKRKVLEKLEGMIEKIMKNPSKEDDIVIQILEDIKKLIK